MLSKNALVTEVKKKLIAKKSRTGTFYIINDKFIYSVLDGGIPFKTLWKKAVSLIFKDFDKSIKKKMMGHPFGIERGQVFWSGDMEKGFPVGRGDFSIEGTPGVAQYSKKIKEMFGLDEIYFPIDENYRSPAFKIEREDEEYFKEVTEEKKPDMKTNIFIAKTL